MSALEIVLVTVTAVLSVALAVSALLLIRTRGKVGQLEADLKELERRQQERDEAPAARKRLRLPTPTQAIRGAVGTAILVKDHGIGGVLRSSIDDLAGWADIQRPDLITIADLDGMVTIFFSDIEDSTPLNHRLGDRAWVSLLSRHDRLVQRAVDEHKGHVIKTQGDGFMVAFGSPADAVAAAADVQQAIAEVRPSSPLAAVRVRVGIHHGSIIHRDNDIFGRNVAMAARIASVAQGGEILVSDAALDRLDGEVRRIESKSVSLKGIPGVHAVHTIDWSV